MTSPTKGLVERLEGRAELHKDNYSLLDLEAATAIKELYHGLNIAQAALDMMGKAAHGEQDCTDAQLASAVNGANQQACDLLNKYQPEDK